MRDGRNIFACCILAVRVSSGLNGLVEVESRMERVLGSCDWMFTPPLRFG